MAAIFATTGVEEKTMSSTITLTLERQFFSLGCHPDYKYLDENEIEIEIDLAPRSNQCVAMRRRGEDESIYVPVKVLRMLLGLIDGA